MSSVVDGIKNKVAGSSPPSGQHLAAILHSAGSALDVTYRPTPTPGPTELLIEVKSVALNPIDWIQRDTGFSLAICPAVVGSDVGGIVVSAGSAVPPDAPKPGTRVAAFAPCFYTKGDPNYGALQKFLLVPASNVTPLPDSISFNEASLLPMAVATAWAGVYTLGIPRDTAYTPADKQGILVWGASSSVGSTVVQVLRELGFRVYATASEKHHEYIKSLGASQVFDYNDKDVVAKIIHAVQQDGVTLQHGYHAIGNLSDVQQVLSALKSPNSIAHLASAPPIPADAPQVDDIETKFVLPPMEEGARDEHIHFTFGVWLKAKLAEGKLVPSPKLKVVPGGLESAQSALDELKAGVSAVKLVLELS